MQVSSKQTFFGVCTKIGGGEMCATGRPGGKGGTGMFLTLLFMIILGISTLVNICRWRGKRCPFVIMFISAALALLAAIMVASYISELNDGAPAAWKTGPAMIMLIFAGLAALVTAAAINKFG